MKRVFVKKTIATAGQRKILLKRRVLAPLLALCIVGTPLCWSAPEPPPQNCQLVIRLNGFGPGLTGYEQQIFELAAKATEAEYGPCEIAVLDADFAFSRFWKELGNGKILHAGISAAVKPDHQENVLSREFRFLGGALGLRKSIVRKDSKQAFEAVESFNSLKTFRVGQGSYWTDIPTYRAMGIPVVDSFKLQHLFRMLAHKRFDHIPLSVLQVDHTYNTIREENPELAIAEKIYIYYPIKTWFHINTNDARLAMRFLSGMERIFANGQAEQLFQQGFAGWLDALKAEQGRIFVLPTPSYSTQENRKYTRDFLTRYQLEPYLVKTGQQQQSQ